MNSHTVYCATLNFNCVLLINQLHVFISQPLDSRSIAW